MEVKISVIIPVYKVERYLRKCVESVLNQSYTNLEVILVDDGSPDNCGMICDELASTDNRIIVIHKKNGGLSDARNAGLDIATGEYICFIDSDDYIEQDMLNVLYNHLVADNADISMCSATVVDEHDNIIDILSLPAKVSTGMEVIEDYDYFHGAYIVAWNKLYKKALFNNVRYDKGKIHEDEFIFHKIFSQAEKVTCISQPYYYYLKRKGSIMSERNRNEVLHSIEALNRRIEWEIEYCSQTMCIYRAINEVSRRCFQYKQIKETGQDGADNAFQHQIKRYKKNINRYWHKEKQIKRKIVVLLECVYPGIIHIIKRKRK